MFAQISLQTCMIFISSTWVSAITVDQQMMQTNLHNVAETF